MSNYQWYMPQNVNGKISSAMINKSTLLKVLKKLYEALLKKEGSYYGMEQTYEIDMFEKTYTFQSGDFAVGSMIRATLQINKETNAIEIKKTYHSHGYGCTVNRYYDRNGVELKAFFY